MPGLILDSPTGPRGLDPDLSNRIVCTLTSRLSRRRFVAPGLRKYPVKIAFGEPATGAAQLQVLAPMPDLLYSTWTKSFVARGRGLFDSGDYANLLYAALEVRMGTEARLQSYVHAHKQISGQIKNGWKIKELADSLAKHFVKDDLVAQVTVTETSGAPPVATLQYIPVSAELRKVAEQLGNYLHHREYKVNRDESWWAKLRELVSSGLDHLSVCAGGTLLGPPLWRPSTGEVDIKLELHKDDSCISAFQELASTKRQLIFGVKYEPVDSFYSQMGANNSFKPKPLRGSA